jgi:hypothetical protein
LGREGLGAQGFAGRVSHGASRWGTRTCGSVISRREERGPRGRALTWKG